MILPGRVFALCLLVTLCALAPPESRAQTAQTDSAQVNTGQTDSTPDPASIDPLRQLLAADSDRLTTAQKAFVQNWLETADQAEAAIASATPSTALLEALRSRIAYFRDGFAQTRDQNAARIDTLQAQLDALGPKPADGEEEPREFAAIRKNLEQRQFALRFPAVISNEAYNRADGMIREIDRLIRDRQRRAILQRTASPLDWQVWPVLVRGVYNSAAEIVNETRIHWHIQTRQQQFRKHLPQALLYLAIGVLLLFRGRRWAEQVGGYLRSPGNVRAFLISLGRLCLLIAGVHMMIEAVSTAGLPGLRGDLVLRATSDWALLFFGFAWLAERLYPRDPKDDASGTLVDDRTAARRNLIGLGIVMVLFDMVHVYEQVDIVSRNVRTALVFPAVLLGALVLFRLRRIARNDQRDRADTPQDTRRRIGLTWIAPLFRWTAGLVAIAAPVMAALGYGALAEAVLLPYIKTIALYGTLMVLQAFCRDVHAWFAGKSSSKADESILPICISFALAILSLPVLALVWGVRTAELTALWNRFLQGVQIGDSRISPVDFLTFAVVFAIGYGVTRMAQTGLKTGLLPRTNLKQGEQNAVVSGTGYAGIFLAALIAVSTVGINLSSLAIVAGALSVGIGFGLQNIVSNFVSGIILLIERPVTEGDWIEVGGTMGYVRDISVRSTRIETFDRSDVILPNSDLVSGTVTNFTRGNTVGRLTLPIGVAYGTDTRQVETILREIAESHPVILANPAPSIVFREFGADSLNFEIRAILRDVNQVLSVRSEMNHRINARFAEAGIEIPFAQRSIWLRNPEALRPSPDAARAVPHELQLPEDNGAAPDDD